MPIKCIEDGFKKWLTPGQVEFSVIDTINYFIGSLPVVHVDAGLEKTNLKVAVHLGPSLLNIDVLLVNLLLFHFASETFWNHYDLEHELIEIV